MRISDWSSDVCSSDLASAVAIGHGQEPDVLAAATGRPIHVAPVVDVVEGSAPVARPRLVHAESIALVFRAQVGVAEVRARNVDEGAHVPGRCQTVGPQHYRAAPVLVGGVDVAEGAVDRKSAV